MSIRLTRIALSLVAVFSLAIAAAPQAARAAIPQSVLALAGPLAQDFGVSSDAVTSLLQKGISLESVTALLLVTQSAKKSLDEVTALYTKNSNDVKKAADQLGVAASKYSPDRVEAAIDKAKQQVADEAAGQAADAASKAVGGMLGGKRY